MVQSSFGIRLKLISKLFTSQPPLLLPRKISLFISLGTPYTDVFLKYHLGLYWVCTSWNVLGEPKAEQMLFSGVQYSKYCFIIKSARIYFREAYHMHTNV